MLNIPMTQSTPTQYPVLPKDAVKLTECTKSPHEIASTWSKKEHLIALIAGNGEGGWSRWSIIAPAHGKRLTLNTKEDLATFQQEIESITHTSLIPGWIGYLGYELGSYFEPNAVKNPTQDSWPLADFIWCDKCLVHDSESNTWWSVGGLALPEEVVDCGEIFCDKLIDEDGDEQFNDAVKQTKQYIYEGDIFQANITRRFTADVSGDLRSHALQTLASPGGWFGAWIEFPSVDSQSLLSLSPELFLQYNGDTRTVVSRPMKGTRPLAELPELLLQSEKDAAELHMIVDLMRNDLGRVCEFGSMNVTEARTIERHPTVWQCAGEVVGTLRSDTTIYDLLAATFPAGSITGAPKIRAMQIIDELESTSRGPYCGSIGIIGGSMLLNVAIRTAAIDGKGSTSNFHGSLRYGTGCGIVADSIITEECEESHVKTSILRTSPLFMQKPEIVHVAESQQHV